ncbi:MAG TPA: cation:proton antiporter [Thermodesulfobacteriota bacterium]|nr:cation:proton antiporter [Thermodesulfobacteriota bacterium]
MQNLTQDNIMVFFLSLGLLLGAARVLGELAQRIHQPAILGELLAGLILGPTILGSLAPETSAFLFPQEGPNAVALNAFTTLAVTLLMLVAGMEVDLSTIWRQGRIGLKAGTAGMVIPFFLGLVVALIAPRALGSDIDADPLVFSLFFATALSISALPVIAKTLMDLDLYRSDFGMVVISAAILNDLIGWIIFAIILGLIGAESGQSNNIFLTITLTLAFAGVMLTLGRSLVHRTLPFLQAYTRWPGGVLSFALVLALLGAAFTEWIGIHAIFGAFIVGVAVGDSSHLRERTRVIIDEFVSFIFAPVFFASIGLNVNFITHFDLVPVLTVLLIACVCKLAGGVLGARWGDMTKRDAWAVGFAMNARGAMEIILGLLALQAGIIRPRLFVALVIMAIVTSMISGPAIRLILRLGKKRTLLDALSSRLFTRELQAFSSRMAIHELTAMACEASGLNTSEVEAAVWEREETLPTGIGNGVALPHARIEGISKPIVAIGISDSGIDFDAPDDKPAYVIFLILTPVDAPDTQLEITAELAKLFRVFGMTEKVLKIKSYTEFLALVKSSTVEANPA